ncbi:unnamed protein product [Polarella glacialis]|uniref:TIR domain-containing protein n=1 Tax=Polarella glacialis TaxID=89957 RepID=A0A813KXF6_POLGL|nr:unnamed protein product [Polarella glacialis]
MSATKRDAQEAMVAARTDVEEAKDAARQEVEAATAATRLEVKEAMAVAKHDVEEAILTAKKDVEEAKAAAREEVEAAMATTKRAVQEAMVAAEMNVEEAKAAAMAATKLGIDEAKNAAFNLGSCLQTYAERQARAKTISAGVPLGRKYHYFLSHKKKHSVLGRQPESLAMALHDSQTSAGFVGFFDVDDLKTITPQQLSEDVSMSCAMIVVLNDETYLSSWCQLEWKAAELAGIPVLCIVDAQNVSRATVLEQVERCGSHLMVHQWVSYIDTYRHDATRQITDWLHEHCTLKTVGRTHTS